MSRLHQTDFLLILILIVGFSLRIVGIGVGLPDYPDPREPLIAQDILNLVHLQSPPQIYNWPGTAWFYLIAMIGKLLEVGGLNLTVARVIWLARFVNTLLSTATIWFTYRIGARCYRRSVGLIGAGLLAVTMLHATNESRFALVDIPATFCVTLLLWCCAKSPDVSFRRAIWMGIIAGVGFAVKFTTAFAGLALVASLGIRRSEAGHGFALKLVTVVCSAAITFTAICPYWLIDLFSSEWNLFFDAFFYEASHYRLGHFGLFATGEIGWLDRFTYLWTLLRWGMGVPLGVLALLGIVLAATRRKDGDGMLLAFVLPYLLFVGFHKLKFARHLLLIYPALTLFAAAGIDQLSKVCTPVFTLPPRWTKGFAGVVLGIAGGYSLIYTAAFASVTASPPTMREAARWMEANLPPEASVERAPEILFDWLLPKVDWADDRQHAPWALVLMPNAEVFLNYAAKPQTYTDTDWHPIAGIDAEAATAFYGRIFGDAYVLARSFQRHPRFLGIPISDRGAPFPMRALAHPEIRIYRLKD